MLAIAFELILILSFIVIPGLCVLRFFRFQYRNSLDLVLAMSITGFAVSGLWVYALLAARFYYSFAPLFLIGAPAAWLSYQYKYTNRLLPEVIADEELEPVIAPAQVSAKTKPRESSKRKPVGRALLQIAPKTLARMTALDGVAVFSGGFVLFVLFCVSFTSPIQSWDALITWDKWATDWAARSNLYNYAQGGYPQLLPMFSSLLYKITGHYSVAVPSDQYALHAFHAALGFLLLVAVVRAGQLLRLPVWVLVAVIFGFRAIQSIITSGSADLLVTVLFFITVILYLGWRDREWEARFHGTPVLIAGLFAAAFTKAGGILALLFVLLANVLHRGGASGRCLPRRALAASLLMPLLLLVPFYLAQYTASRQPIEEHNPKETNFPMPGMLGGLKQTADRAYAGRSGFERLNEAGAKVLDEYSDSVKIVGTVVGILLVIMASASVFVAAVRPVLVTTITLVAVWYRFASYDLRNLLPAIPLLGICIAAGGVEIYVLLERHQRPRSVLLGVVGCMALLIGGRSILAAFVTIEDSFAAGKLGLRIEAAEASMPEKVKEVFPDDYNMLGFLSRLHILNRAHYVVAGGALYRWVPGGVYPFCQMNPQMLGPGDLYLVPQPHLPNGNAWTMLRGSGGLRAWLWEKDPVVVPLPSVTLTGASAPKLLLLSPDILQVEAGGNQALMVYNLPDRESASGLTVVWQVLVEADERDPALEACSLTYNPAILDPESSVASVDLSQAGQHLLKYSGTLAIKPGAISHNMADGILFGLCRTGLPKAITLSAFRYSTYLW